MLKSLFIRNFVLIDSLDIKFDKGFSVITGETGAGKSIILGALSLVLGQRADGKSIKNGSEKQSLMSPDINWKNFFLRMTWSMMRRFAFFAGNCLHQVNPVLS